MNQSYIHTHGGGGCGERTRRIRVLKEVQSYIKANTCKSKCFKTYKHKAKLLRKISE